MFRSKKQYWRSVIAALTLVLGLMMSTSTPQAQSGGNPNPRVIPNNGPLYGRLGAVWWQWALSFPLADIPFFNAGGAVDVIAHQSGNIWFLAGANFGPAARSGEIPAGTSLFFPLANLINDYPCPPQFGFEPDPGETLEHFLQRT
jgi:hypothetical protein